MSLEDDNVAIVRKAYELWGSTRAGSVDHWMALMADEVDWRSLADGGPGMEFTRRASTREQVRGYLEGLVNDWEMLRYDVDEFIAQRDRVVMLGHCAWKHRVTGKFVDMPKCDVLRLRDGKIVGFMEYYDTAKAIGATLT
jgi:ketosteroid isomerase-like protein